MNVTNVGVSSWLVTDLKQTQNEPEKAGQAAQEFEALLLASWLEEVQQGISALNHEEQEPGKNTTQAIGMQAIASGVAARGGLGLAKMLLKHLSLAPSASSGDFSASSIPELPAASAK
jgi:Rod binding domain-containing protein